MRKIDSITTFLSVAFVFAMILPDNWMERTHVGAIPFGFLVFCALCLPLLWILLVRRGVMTRTLAASFVVLIVTSFLGLFRGNIGQYSIKFYVADIFTFGGFLAGYVIARSRSREETMRFASLLATICSFVVILTYIGLFAGLVTTNVEAAGRLATLSIFNACGLMIVLLPWVTASSHFRNAKDSWKLWLFFATALGTAFVSATRSFLIEVALAACLYVIIRRRKLGTAFFFRLACAVFALGLLLMVGLPRIVTFSFQRLDNTEITGEGRYEELSLWWTQVRDDFWTGQGMGSRFVSNIVIDGNPLASTPHIGIVTFLMKGGIAMFLAYSVLPPCIALVLLFSVRLPENQRGAAASVLMFTTVASLSGGWSVLYLFGYGLAIASMTAKAKAPIRSQGYLDPVRQARVAA